MWQAFLFLVILGEPMVDKAPFEFQTEQQCNRYLIAKVVQYRKLIHKHNIHEDQGYLLDGVCLQDLRTREH